MSVVVSGMRPTGRLHIGHLEGVLRNWISLQADHQCYFFVADLHALTDRTEPETIAKWSIEMVKDWLAIGIDPDRAVIFQQSDVVEHTYLHTLLSMISSVGWLERCPTYKERISELGEGSENLGLLAYPVLMCADVALYGADRIPVGEDQVVHLEMAREIVRRFNTRFPGADLVAPQPLLTRTAKLLGTDGRKMSKSYGNTIELSATAEETNARIKTMKTDERRQRRQDPGNPDTCVLYPYQEIYSPDRTAEIREGCTTAGIGCVDCKKILMENYALGLADFHERRARLTDSDVRAVLAAGAERASAAARVTIRRVRRAVGFAFAGEQA